MTAKQIVAAMSDHILMSLGVIMGCAKDYQVVKIPTIAAQIEYNCKKIREAVIEGNKQIQALAEKETL